MSFFLRIWFWVVLIFTFVTLKTYSQGLSGMSLPVSSSQVVVLRFMSVIKTYDISGEASKNSFQVRFLDKKTISIRSIITNFSNTNLVVREGRYTHLFILKYKENLDSTENSYYITDDFIKVMESIVQQPPPKAAPPIIKDTSGPKAPVSAPGLTVQQRNDKYADLFISANRAYTAKDYDLAEKLYKEALQLKPDEDWPKSQLKAIESIRNKGLLEDQRKESLANYQRYIKSGDSAFNKKAYPTARLFYNQALNEKPNDRDVALKLSNIDNAIKNENYLSALEVGKVALSNKQFENAVNAFNEALKYKPKDPEALRLLATIGPARSKANAQQATDKTNLDKENLFRETVSLADTLLKDRIYEQAKLTYTKALKINPQAGFLKAKIKQVDSLLTVENNSQGKLKQDSLRTANFNSQIQKADKAFEYKDYKKAKAIYQAAQILRPEEKYPLQKISEIEVLISRSDEERKNAMLEKFKLDSINKQYDFFVKRGTAAISKNEFYAAQDFFAQASILKPGEKFPLDQLAIVKGKLKEIKDTEQYELYLHRGDSVAFVKNVTMNNYKEAINWYDLALKVKPSESFPRKRKMLVNEFMMKLDSTQVAAENTNIRNEKYNLVQATYQKAEAARLQRNYPEAYKLYSEFTNKIDLANFAKYTSSQQANIKQANDMLSRLERYKPDPVADSLRNVRIQDSIKNASPARGRRRRS